ncbi:MAG: hypothetical protein ACP5RP_04130 [Candidatus Micrarchaeia archaeon]
MPEKKVLESRISNDVKIASDPHSSPKLLNEIFFYYYSNDRASEQSKSIRRLVAENPNVDPTLMRFIVLSDNEDEFVKAGVIHNPNLDEELLSETINRSPSDLLYLLSEGELELRKHLRR